MASFRKNVRVLTTRLTAGECIDRLRRISERDDGDDSRHRNVFEPQSLLLLKTHDGFTLRIRRPGSLSLGGVLRVRFEEDTISGERLKLVGRIGANTANGTSAIAAVVAVMLGGVWWSAFRAHLVVGIAVAFGILGLSFLIVLIGRAIFEPDCEGLFDIVKSAVDGDGWRGSTCR
jgi:hypothetical protein